LEGPRWRAGRLAVIAPRGQEAYLFDAAGTLLTRRPAPTPNGTSWLDDTTLLFASMTDRIVYAWDTVADHLSEYADLREFATGTLSDMMLAPDGHLYVGAHADDALNVPKTELNRPSILMRVSPDGSVAIENEDLMWPNGVAITGGAGRVLVAETYASRITSFSRRADGSLEPGTTWHTFAPRAPEDCGPGYWGQAFAPDGLCIDAEDGLWVADASGHGITRLDAAGTVTDFIDTAPFAVFASTLGGPEGRTLYMTAATQHGRDDIPGGREPQLLAVEVEVPGPES